MRAIILRFPISKPVNESDTIILHLLYIALLLYIPLPNATHSYHQNLDLQSYSKMNYVNTSEHLNQTV